MPPEIQIQREIDVERLRLRLRGMTDEQLLQFGKAARYMVTSYANNGNPPQSLAERLSSPQIATICATKGGFEKQLSSKLDTPVLMTPTRP